MHPYVERIGVSLFGVLLLGATAAWVTACSGSDSSNIGNGAADAAPDSPGVHSTDDAKRAYLGLDKSVDKAITLGFQGFNAATNANIPTQSTTGDATGTMTVGGQVDQGQSSNKTMRLTETLVKYSDDGVIAYDTSSPGQLDMTLNKIPTGTLSGTLVGTFQMSGAPLDDGGVVSTDAGALVGSVTLNLSFTGTLQAGSDSKVERKPGTTHITGTATSGADTYTVDVTR